MMHRPGLTSQNQRTPATPGRSRRSRLTSLLVAVGTVLLLLSGCSAWRPPAVRTDALPVDYFPDSLHGVERSVHELATADDMRLSYTRYRAESAEVRIALIYLHGIESHAGWFKGAAERLALRGYDVYCLDRRGSGVNRENAGFFSGDIDHRATWLSDVKSLRDLLSPDYSELHLIGLSWGGKQAVAYAIEHPADLASLILITPGIRSRIQVGLFTKAAIGIGSFLVPSRGFELPMKEEMFTADPVFQERMRQDPLRLKHTTLRFLVQSARLDRFIDQGIARSFATPILLLLAENDPIIDNESVLITLRLGIREPSEVHVFQNQIHSLQFDAVDELVECIDAWIRTAKATTTD